MEKKKYLEEKSFSLKKRKKIRHFSSYLLIIRAQCGILPKHFSKLFLWKKTLILNLDIFLDFFLKKIDKIM